MSNGKNISRPYTRKPGVNPVESVTERRRAINAKGTKAEQIVRS